MLSQERINELETQVIMIREEIRASDPEALLDTEFHAALGRAIHRLNQTAHDLYVAGLHYAQGSKR